MLVVSQTTFGDECGACVVVYHVHVENRIPLSLGVPLVSSMRAASAAAKASGASAAPFCKACCNMEKLGKQNGEAHPRVPPCTWVRKAPAPRKKTRPLRRPAATGDVGESEAEPAPAATCSSASFLWD